MFYIPIVTCGEEMVLYIGKDHASSSGLGRGNVLVSPSRVSDVPTCLDGPPSVLLRCYSGPSK